MTRLLFLLLFALPTLASDITVAYISRAPELDYVWASANPGTDGWPPAGTTVTWRAHVRSWRSETTAVPYVWRIDGVEVARGTATFAPNAVTIVELPRLWTFDRHRVSFALDGAKELEVFSDALSVGF